MSSYQTRVYDTASRLECGHMEFQHGHCAHLGCTRFISSCPTHAIARTGETCNLIPTKETDP